MSDVSEISGFTPGPWRIFNGVEHFMIGIGDLNGDGVTDCGFGIWRGTSDEAHANARLIAAAPDMHAEIARLRREKADMTEALGNAIKVANEAAEEWDKAPAGMRAGKILLALAGHRPGYRQDIDAIHTALRSTTETKDGPT